MEVLVVPQTQSWHLCMPINKILSWFAATQKISSTGLQLECMQLVAEFSVSDSCDIISTSS